MPDSQTGSAIALSGNKKGQRNKYAALISIGDATASMAIKLAMAAGY